MSRNYPDQLTWQLYPTAIPLGTYTLGDRTYDLGWVPPMPMPLRRAPGLISPAFPFVVWGPGVLDYEVGWNMGPYGSIHFAALLGEIARRLEALLED